MIDVQQRALSTFEHDEVAAFTCLIQQIGHINYHAGQNVSNCHDIVQNFLVINRFNFVEVNQLEVMVFQNFFQFVGKGGFVEQVANAQATTGHFVFIRRADTATGSTDSFRTARFLTSHIQRYVIIKNQRASFR
ncbi:hypothetical protein D3C75_608970 [compost metagenome]